MAGVALPSADAPGAAPGPDRRPHLLLVPNSADGQAALDRSDARVIARYDEFTLAEASGVDDERLRAAGADRRDDMRRVGLPDADVDPLTQRASLAARSAPDREEVLALAQFVGPVKDAWLDRLRATGARIVQYVAENGYVVHARGPAVDRLSGLVGTYTAVRAVTPVVAGDKLDASLTGAGAHAVAVQTVSGGAGASARRRARAAGDGLAEPFGVGELRTQFLRLLGAEVAALAADPGVVAITAWSPPELRDERAAQIVAGNVTSGGAPTGPGYLDWLDDQGFPGLNFGFTVDVTDSGLDDGAATSPAHPDFYVDGVKPGLDRVDYATDYTVEDSDARDCVGHGTNVASILAGYGGSTPSPEDGQGYAYGTGVAPQALMGSSKMFDCDFDFSPTATFAQVTAAAWAEGAVISNNSWGRITSPTPGRYDTFAQAYDRLVRDASPGPGNQEMVEVFAAGNDGTATGYRSIDSPGSAKNVITVGASEGVRAVPGTDGCGVPDALANNAGQVLALSSRGPTQDGRIKPDLVAPGSHITGAAPQHPQYNGLSVCNEAFPSTNPFHSLSSGTSQAAPHVSGAAALIRDWFTREQGLAPPSPAMTKAVLTNAASDLAAAGPDHDAGWGRVNVGTALDSAERVYVDQPGGADLIDQSGDSWLDSYTVADPVRPLKVTLAWTDPPGPIGGNALVNNLDLVVEAGGRTYRGNAFGNGVSVAGGNADSRNNLEGVYLPAGAAGGRFSVRVVGTNVAADGVPGVGDGLDQDFALVVSNAQTDTDAPVLVHQRSQVTDGSPGDRDGALEPGEGFTLDETVRNAGDADAAAPVAGVLSAGYGLTVSRPAAAWPTIPRGTARASSFDPAARVQTGVVCGTDVTGTLAVTTSAGTQAIPLTLPTGAPQTATVNSRSHSAGLVLPDNNAAGASSTITVTRPGRIKDLNVRIGTIVHPWIGDLRIDIVGPDGTTVTLADHPGGPDNQGNSMVGTVFDDEAGVNVAAGAAPYSGRFKPQRDQLSRFDGKLRQGVWRLRVRDLVAGESGRLVSWGTEMSRPACNFTASPQTTIQSGPSSPTTQTSATFTFGAGGSGAGGGYECRLDGALFSECASGRSYSGLGVGSHTFAVRAVDSTGNVDATPATRTWTVQAPPKPPDPPTPPAVPADTTAPSFALLPKTHSWTDARKRRLKLLAGCASACRLSAKLSVSRATARRLGVKRTLGRASARLIRAGAKFVPVRLTAGGRAVARRRSAVRARLAVTLRAGSATVRLSPTITLRNGGGLRSLGRRGLGLAGDCSERCSTTTQVLISAREARRLDLTATGGGPFTVAEGSTGRSDRPFTMTLRASRAYRRALTRARGLRATLSALVRGTTGPTARASGGLKLRR